jgi:very-short-patch-repair endonuclease
MLKYNPKLKNRARELRKSQTDSEYHLWTHLKGRQFQGIQFYRQKPIGNYIVDFYAPKAKLVIEIDGSQHLEQKGIEEDHKRDRVLMKLGLRVIRFSSRDVLLQTEAVLEDIFSAIAERYSEKSP